MRALPLVNDLDFESGGNHDERWVLRGFGTPFHHLSHVNSESLFSECIWIFAKAELVVTLKNPAARSLVDGNLDKLVNTHK